MTATGSCTLHALLAARSTAAVVYRRGPSKLTCLIRWDRADDTFEVGQWFKGSVYPDRSALAPDGAHLLTFMGTFRPPFGTWTALSRPPYFTALALWPKGDTWGGGGYFLGERAFVLAHSDGPTPPAPGLALPEGFALLPPGPATDAKVARALAADPTAWRPVEGPGGARAARGHARAGPDGVGLLATWHADDPGRPYRGERRLDLTCDDRRVRLPDVGWAAFDAGGDLLFAVGGRLFRCPAPILRTVASAEDVVAHSRLLADFTALTFRPLAAPYAAARTEDLDLDGGYAPVLDRVTKADRRARREARLARAERR